MAVRWVSEPREPKAPPTYGETTRLWTGPEAAGFAKLHFEYVQPWVGKQAKTEDDAIVVGSAKMRLAFIEIQ